MTVSGGPSSGLRSDATRAVYSEDVVTYSDPAAAAEWDEAGGATTRTQNEKHLSFKGDGCSS